MSFIGKYEPVRGTVEDKLSLCQTAKLGATDKLWGNTSVFFCCCGLTQDNCFYLESESMKKFAVCFFAANNLYVISFLKLRYFTTLGRTVLLHITCSAAINLASGSLGKPVTKVLRETLKRLVNIPAKTL